MKIYRIKCKLCGKTIEADYQSLAMLRIKMHLVSHEEFNKIINPIISLLAEQEEEEIEVAIV